MAKKAVFQIFDENKNLVMDLGSKTLKMKGIISVPSFALDGSDEPRAEIKLDWTVPKWSNKWSSNFFYFPYFYEDIPSDGKKYIAGFLRVLPIQKDTIEINTDWKDSRKLYGVLYYTMPVKFIIGYYG